MSKRPNTEFYKCNEHYKEYRFESINKVGISPLVSTIEVMDANLELVAFSFSNLKPDFSDLEPDFSDTEPDFPDFKNDFSNLELKPMAVCGNKFGKITAKKMSRSGSKDKVKISPSVIPVKVVLLRKIPSLPLSWAG